MKKNRNKLPKWRKILGWILAVLICFFVILILGLKIFVSTRKEYKNGDFSIKVPAGWTVKETNKDESVEQYVFDAGSFVKLGDSDTDFVKGSDGVYYYQGKILVYIYKYPKTQLTFSDLLKKDPRSNFLVSINSISVKGKKVLKYSYRHNNFYSNDYYLEGSKDNNYKINVDFYGNNNLFIDVYCRTLEKLIIYSTTLSR